MADPLSIANLLSLLNIDRKNDAVRLCEEAEGLRRRKRYEKAVEAGIHAERIARSAFDYELHGTTLLYLGVMHAFRNAATDKDLANRHCDRAVRAFALNPHNHAISQLIRAQIESQLKQADEAIIHFYSTRQTLHDLIISSREYKREQMAVLYESLYNSTNATITNIYASLTEVEHIAIARKRTRQFGARAGIQSASEHSQASKELFPIPLKIVWPTPTSTTFELSPVNADPANQSIGRPSSNNNPPDYIKLSEVSINGEPFAIQPIHPISGTIDSALKIYQGAQYLSILAQASEGKEEYSNTYMLVRRQDHPDRKDQYVVVNDSINNSAWVERADRHWNLHAEIEASDPDNKEPRIIGIVEAWLKPLL